jgi:hypothetical protein
MCTELEVIEAEIVEAPAPLSEGKAKVLDKRIRQASARVVDNTATLLNLLDEAAVGQIHVALGFPSWPAWVRDAVQISPTDDTERKSLVQLMNGKGMSQRAIADVVGVNQATVSRDLSEAPADADASADTEGLDGKVYPKQPKKQKPLDVDEVEPVEKQQPVSADFKEEMYMLANSVSSFQDILADERFPKARNTIAKNNLNRLQELIGELQKIVDELMS